MYYPVYGMMHIKEPLLLIGKSSPCGGSGFPLSLSEWSFTICVTPYTRKLNVLSVSLNKTFPFVISFYCLILIQDSKKLFCSLLYLISVGSTVSYVKLSLIYCIQCAPRALKQFL